MSEEKLKQCIAEESGCSPVDIDIVHVNRMTGEEKLQKIIIDWMGEDDGAEYPCGQWFDMVQDIMKWKSEECERCQKKS